MDILLLIFVLLVASGLVWKFKPEWIELVKNKFIAKKKLKKKK